VVSIRVCLGVPPASNLADQGLGATEPMAHGPLVAVMVFNSLKYDRDEGSASTLATSLLHQPSPFF
jgi:hypothetical protein